MYNLLTDPIISLVEQLKISSNQKRRSKADGMKVRFSTVSTRGFQRSHHFMPITKIIKAVCVAKFRCKE